MTTRHPDLPLEQQRNAEYLRWLEKWLTTPVSYGLSRNEVWVNPNPNGHGKSYDALHPLIGRVGLTEPDEDLGTNFYVGARWCPGDTYTISWLAPIARAFFRPDDPDHGLAGRIAAIRTFTSRVRDVVGVHEEWYADGKQSPFAAPHLSVSAPAVRGARRQLATPASDGSHPAGAGTASSHASSAEASGPPGPLAKASQVVGMRASGAVLGRLQAPRARELVSVLATLQPDQHDLVTRPADTDLVIQGHPGTGKTVIAAYRAGYLITPADPDRQEYGGGRRRVLLIGPTPGYVAHVAGLVRPFQSEHTGELIVTDLGSFMAEIVGFKSSWAGGIDGERDDVDEKALGLVLEAAKLVRATVGYIGTKEAARRDVAITYSILTNNGIPDRTITEDPATKAWLTKLPAFDEASRLRRYLPLLAQCRMAQKPVPDGANFDHVIVDEAQDVSPMEWSLLDKYCHPWRGRWTLVGDQNQRRSHTSHTTWNGVVAQLDLGNDDSRGVHHEVMERGYRSTNEILRFADGLLAPSLRRAGSIQDGGAPVHRVPERKSKRLYSRALGVASELARKHPGGTVALITVSPERLVEQMGTAGWRRPVPADHRTWSLADVTVQVYSPELARGLEFDAVVVIEPNQYDNDNGRHGQLYTSLTRANRELAVVYHQKLPAGLRARK